MKEVEIRVRGDDLAVGILCEIDHHTAKTIREAVDAELERVRPKNLILDFSGVGFMDSSGIGLILGRVTESEKIGASVCIEGLSPMLMKLVRMAGLEKLKGVKIKARSGGGREF